MKAMTRRKVERMPDMVFGIQISGGRPRRRHGCDLREIDAAGVDHRKFEQATRGERFKMSKSGGSVRDEKACINARCQDRGIGRIDHNVDLRANSFNDAGVNLPVERLRTSTVIGVGVNDGRTSAGAGDALGNDRVDRIRDTGL
jgi:hypothetical protein